MKYFKAQFVKILVVIIAAQAPNLSYAGGSQSGGGGDGPGSGKSSSKY